MKPTLSALVLSSLLITSALPAQTSKREYKIPSTESIAIAESKAVKNFRRSHPDVTNESWRSEKGYYFVTFKDGDIKNKIAYTRNGHLDYSVKMYKEKNLPSRIRSAVKNTYYDYSITDVQELNLKTDIIYLVKITDTNTWKTIRVSNGGDLEEIENYSTVISPCR